MYGIHFTTINCISVPLSTHHMCTAYIGYLWVLRGFSPPLPCVSHVSHFGVNFPFWNRGFFQSRLAIFFENVDQSADCGQINENEKSTVVWYSHNFNMFSNSRNYPSGSGFKMATTESWFMQHFPPPCHKKNLIIFFSPVRFRDFTLFFVKCSVFHSCIQCCFVVSFGHAFLNRDLPRLRSLCGWNIFLA